MSKRSDRYGLAMPHVAIEIRRECSAAEELALIDAVHAALRRAFRIPASDRHVRLIVHEPRRFAVPPRLAEPDRFTLVTVDAFAGRSPEAKRELYREIVEGLAPLGVPADHVSIVVRDAPLENWGIRGGRAASELDLGFDVNV
jgi:phenylpyruvate tautomerase PptA (4-oxalocrotonate tautomerase family)